MYFTQIDIIISQLRTHFISMNNIVNKYRLMKQEEISVRDDGKEFAVAIPLIQPAAIAIHT